MGAVLALACGGRGSAGTAGRSDPSGATPVLYFVLTDRFFNGDRGNDYLVDRSAPGAYHGGDLAGLREKLPYLAELGVDVVWISPVVDNVEEPSHAPGFPHYGFHGYWAKDFEAIEEHQGTAEDLRGLVVDAGARGMRVLLDVVLNHPGYGARWERDPKWTRSPSRGDCGDTPETECIYQLPDFRTERDEVIDYLIRVHLEWARRSGVWGFRVDAARHLDVEALRRLRNSARAVGLYLLGEVWGSAPGDGKSERLLTVFDGLYDFGFHEETYRFLTGATDAAHYADYLKRRGPNAHRFVTFLNTHDTLSFLHRLGGDKELYRKALLLLMTLPGTPLLYYGDEVARPGADWPHNRTDMVWTPAEGADLELFAYTRDLIRLHKTLTAPLEIEHASGQTLTYRRGPHHFTISAVSAD